MSEEYVKKNEYIVKFRQSWNLLVAKLDKKWNNK